MKRNEFTINSLSIKGTFHWELHEMGRFDTILIQDLYRTIIEKIKEFESEPYDQGEFAQFIIVLYRLVAYVYRSICSHFDPNDLVEVADLPEDYNVYVDRLDFLFKKAVERTTVGIDSYEDDLGRLI